MPRDANNEYVPPVNWDGVIHPEFGNQADWVYAIVKALNERLAVNGGLNDIASFDVIPIINSYMFFDFANKVEQTILNMVGNINRITDAGTGDVIEVMTDYRQREKWNGWLNPEQPMITGEDSEDVYIDGPMGHLSYNFLDGKQLLQMEGCNFREPLTSGFSSLETCFPVWFERVKNAINKLHLTPVGVNWATEDWWGYDYYSNYDDESMGGSQVDSVAWGKANANYGTHGYSPLPDGDSRFSYPEDKYNFFTQCYTEAERRAIDKSIILYASWTFRSSFWIQGYKVFVKRLYGGYPRLGCHVYAGGMSTIGATPQGGYQFDEFHDDSHAKNEVFTIDCGAVSSTDPLQYINGSGWSLILNDTDKYHPPYQAPPIDPDSGTGELETRWGHNIFGRFYADWAEEDDGFQFKENSDDEGGDGPHEEPIPGGQ
jgi:hypothetical protein